MSKTALERLKELRDLQCQDGNWNWDPYTHGYANGLILSAALMESPENPNPKFLSAPPQWLRDTPIPPLTSETPKVSTDDFEGAPI